MAETVSTAPRTDTTLTLADFLRLMPKAELHCHLYGTVRLPTMLDLARRNCNTLSSSEIESWYVRGEKPVGVLRVLRALEQSLIRDADNLYQLVYEYLADAAGHAVRYAEFAWNPTGTIKGSGLSWVQSQAAIVRAVADAERDHGIVGRLIAAIDREASPEDAAEMVALVAADRAPETIGVGIDYNELDHPPETFWKAYALARRSGLEVTAHAGEFGAHWRNIETALDVLGVSRIDHGYTILDNPDLVRRCADRGIVFTVVPTNSYYLRTLPREEWARRHPIRFMPREGLKVHPNTDDPTLHNITPAGAWHMMIKDFDFGLDDLREFMLNGLDGAWISDVTRRQWKRQWAAEFDQLRARIA